MFLSAITFQLSNSPPPPPALSLNQLKVNPNQPLPSILGLPKHFLFSSLSLQSTHPSLSITTTSSVGSPPLLSSPPRWNLTNRHIIILKVVSCVVAISASWLFFSAIPAVLALRRAADSLAKLMDVMREELPDTMAAVRLSGMEISDLTMELSDIGQEITKGVRSSTQAVRMAEDRLRRLTTMVSKGAIKAED